MSLVLSRKLDEELVVRIPAGEDSSELRLKVVEVNRGRVRLAIDAPAEITVLRAEIVDRPLAKTA